MSVPNLKWIALFLQKLLRDVRRKANEIANFDTPRVFNAPADGVPLGILYRRRGLDFKKCRDLEIWVKGH